MFINYPFPNDRKREREEIENARSLHSEERHHLIIRRLFLPQSFYQRPAAVTGQTELIHPPVSLPLPLRNDQLKLFAYSEQQINSDERGREKFSGIHLDVTIIVRDILVRPIES
jgi:hypothetical protein